MLLVRNNCHFPKEVSSETSALHNSESLKITISNQPSRKNFKIPLDL